ncbi:MAG TPA: thioredoxin [Bacteroidales bacterium]|jgi:thioredoxin 1|nr:thioredoxin [Bacteroidales bacterium]
MKGNFNSIISENRLVLVDFHALWCSPCKIQAPVLKEIADEYGECVKVIKIDVDQNNSIAMHFQVQSVPTLIIFKNGNIAYRQSGMHTKAQLKNILDKLV